MTPLSLSSDDVKRVAALRRYLLNAGTSPWRLMATPNDLARFDLVRWDGMFCGIVCVDSPIITAGKA